MSFALLQSDSIHTAWANGTDSLKNPLLPKKSAMAGLFLLINHAKQDFIA